MSEESQMLYDMTPFYSLYFMNWSQYMNDVTDIAWRKLHLFPNPELSVEISVEWAMGNFDVTKLRSKYKGFDLNSQYMPLGILIYKVLDATNLGSDHEQASKMIDFFIAHQATRDKYALRQSAHMLAHTYQFMKREHPKVAEIFLQQSLTSHKRSVTQQKIYTGSFASDYGHQELGHSPFHEDLLGSFESQEKLGDWLKKNMKPSAMASLARLESFSQFKSLLNQSARKKILSEQLGI